MMVDTEVHHEELLTKYLGYVAYATLWKDGRWTLEVFEVTPLGKHWIITDADGDYDERPDEDMVHGMIDDHIAGF